MVKNRYNVRFKRRIVEEAWSEDRNIRPTACKYNLSPSMIRKWKKAFNNTPILSKETGFRIVAKNSNVKDGDIYATLKTFLEERRE